MNPEHQKQSHGIFGIHPWPLGIILGFLLVFAVNFLDLDPVSASTGG